MALAVQVDGLKELRRSFARVDKSLSRELGQAGKKAAEVVAVSARAKVPVKTGRARASVRAIASHGGGAVRAGGARAPHYPWLDFGGRVGRRNSVYRPVRKAGRYIYPSIAEHSADIYDIYERELDAVLRKAGL